MYRATSASCVYEANIASASEWAGARSARRAVSIRPGNAEEEVWRMSGYVRWQAFSRKRPSQDATRLLQ